MMHRPSIPWPTLRCSLLLLCLCILVVGWCRWHGSSHLLLDALQSTIQRGQPVLQPRFTQPNPFDPSTYLGAMPSMQEPNPFISPLSGCSQTTNPITSHRRVPAHHLNISLTPPHLPPLPDRHFNPTFLRLPSWAATSPAAKGAKYVLVTRKVTEGLHQESFICLADLCLPSSASSPLSPDTRSCTASDYSLLGPHGGLRCTTTPIPLDIPPTPALRCSGRWSSFPAFPGFHDPRIFWSNRGEPLMIVNSASQYGCLGLWLIDLRAVSADLSSVLSRDGKRKSWESPVIRYRHLTELTRQDRAEVEKNWMLFFPGGSSSSSDPNEEGDTVVQYDIALKYDFSSASSSNDYSTGSSGRDDDDHPPPATRGRTLSLLHSNTGITIAANLTSAQEPTCFPPSSVLDSLGQRGHWHQSTNALKLILCTRADVRSGACGPRRGWLSSGREVHFSIVHRKFSNSLDLPMRYERFAVVWEGRSPWRLLGVSQSPILFAGEVAQPWTREENEIIISSTANASLASSTLAELKQKKKKKHKRQQQQQQQQDADSSSSTTDGAAQDHETSAYFTYTPSIAWAWQPATDHFDADEQNEGMKHSDHDSEHDITELERLGMGFLGDDLLVGVGLDDIAQAVVRLKVDEIVGCLRLCE